MSDDLNYDIKGYEEGCAKAAEIGADVIAKMINDKNSLLYKEAARQMEAWILIKAVMMFRKEELAVGRKDVSKLLDIIFSIADDKEWMDEHIVKAIEVAKERILTGNTKMDKE